MRFDDAMAALVELAASRHNAVHASEAADIGHHRLRRARQSGHLIQLHHRVVALACLGQPEGQALRAATLARSGAAACHLGAAWLHGWVGHAPQRPEIWVRSSSATSLTGARLQWCAAVDPDRDCQVVDHIHTLNKAATLCLLGRVVDDDELRRCLDEFTRTESMTWLESTFERLWSPTDAGIAALGRILDDPRRVDGVTDSWMERLVADLVNRPHLAPVTLQHRVDTPAGRYRLDVALPEVRLGIEAHSRRFHWGATKVDGDNVRDLELAAAGWEVLYVTWTQLRRPALLLQAIERIVEHRRRFDPEHRP